MLSKDPALRPSCKELRDMPVLKYPDDEAKAKEEETNAMQQFIAYNFSNYYFLVEQLYFTCFLG